MNWAQGGSLLAGIATLGMSACGEQAGLRVEAGIGREPVLPPPNQTLLPTVNIAPAIGWADGATPTPADGLRVTALADELDHPRWLYVVSKKLTNF
jgi:glucose/arabinose dehydrogenase